MEYTYQVGIFENELGGYSAVFPEFPELGTDGDDFYDAVKMAEEALELAIESYIDNGKPLPSFEHRQIAGHNGFISVEIDDRNRLIATKAAAEKLGVSNARVRQLVLSGQLESVKRGRDNLVYIWSVENRLKSSPKPGKPKTKALQ